jgi:hypothetical protein
VADSERTRAASPPAPASATAASAASVAIPRVDSGPGTWYASSNGQPDSTARNAAAATTMRTPRAARELAPVLASQAHPSPVAIAQARTHGTRSAVRQRVIPSSSPRPKRSIA